MSIWDAIILGLIQGLTEFLPVSSSGHLTLGKALLGINDHSILFEVIVHFGTLLAVVTAFSKEVRWLLTGVFAMLRTSKVEKINDNDEDAIRYIFYLITSTIPIVIIGLYFKIQIEDAFANPLLSGYFLIVTGVILLFSRIGLNSTGRISLLRSVFIGIAQAFAILPGISRSGSTIAAGMILGVEREQAAKFSFLMAIPAISGAFILQVINFSTGSLSQNYIIVLATGFVVSYISGYIAIKFLMAIVKKGRFDYFAWYCFAIGFLAIYFLSGN